MKKLFVRRVACMCIFFFFNDTATTEIYTLSLHDALPISPFKRMLEMGVKVGVGTDATRVASYDPWNALYWLTTGKTVGGTSRSEEHTSELQSHSDLVCRLLLEKKKTTYRVFLPNTDITLK